MGGRKTASRRRIVLHHTPRRGLTGALYTITCPGVRPVHLHMRPHATHGHVYQCEDDTPTRTPTWARSSLLPSLKPTEWKPPCRVLTQTPSTNVDVLRYKSIPTLAPNQSSVRGVVEHLIQLRLCYLQLSADRNGGPMLCFTFNVLWCLNAGFNRARKDGRAEQRELRQQVWLLKRNNFFFQEDE